MKNKEKEEILEEMRKKTQTIIPELDKDWAENKLEIDNYIHIRFLTNPKLLNFVGEAFEEKAVDKAVIGEIHSKLTSFLLCNAMNLGYPLMLVFKGSSAIGKTNLANMVTGLFKTKKIGELSPTAMKYSDDTDYTILYHQETSERESGRKSFKFISSDDGGFSAETTIKNPETGEFEIQKTEVPAKGFVTTTTAIELDKEFATRSFTIPLDETQDQTKLIIDYNLSETNRKIAQLTGNKQFGKKYSLIKDLLEHLSLYEIVIPYETEIKRVFPTENIPLRVRRDSKKLITIIKASALLFQHQRPKIIVNNELLLVATWQDLYNAIRIAIPIINATMTGYDSRTKKAIELLPSIILKNQGITSENLASMMDDISQNYAGRILKQLNDSGYVYDNVELKKELGIKGKTKVYSLNNKNRVGTCNDALQDIKWAIVLERQHTFLERYRANCKNPKHQYIVKHYLEEYRRYGNMVYDPIDGNYKKLKPDESQIMKFAALTSEKEETLEKDICQHIGCKMPKPDVKVKVPTAITKLPLEMKWWDLPIFDTILEAEGELLQALSNPFFVDHGGRVKVNKMEDLIHSKFGLGKSQIKAIIKQMIIEGDIHKIDDNHLVLNTSPVKYSLNSSLIKL